MTGSRAKVLVSCVVTLAVSLAIVAIPTKAVANVVIHFDTELLSLNLTGGPFPLPLASDPGNLLGDSIEGYGWVLSSISISLSSQRDPAGPSSPGEACAFLGFGLAGGGRGGSLPPIDPNALHGEQFFVQSFFDVFFDITVTDVDSRAGRDY